MKGLGITIKGFEEISSKEVKELIKTDCKIEEHIVIFETKQKDLCKLAYMSQSLIKVIELLKQFKITDNIKEKVQKIDWKKIIKDKSFKVRCKRLGKHDFTSQEMQGQIGEYVLDKHKAKVCMDSPDLIIYLFINNENCYLGIDYCGFDLSKRDYKIFSHACSLNGAVAYGLIKYTGYNKKGFVLDPFSGIGTIPIETAFFSLNKSINFYKKDKFAFNNFVDIDLSKFDKENKHKDKIIGYDILLRNIAASKKNAKIGGVNKTVGFSRIEVEWLDTKFKEHEVDFIITHPPIDSKIISEKEIEKIYKEFFYQADYVLSKGGRIGILSTKDKLLKKCTDKFKLEKETEVMQGKQKLKVLVFKR